MSLRIRIIHFIRQALGKRYVRVVIHPFVFIPMYAIREFQRRSRVRKLTTPSVQLTSPAHLDSFFSRFSVVDTNVPLLRIGGVGDGGYIVPDDLEEIAACFSPGISTMVDFELAMAKRSIPSFMADASIKHPPTNHELFDFEPVFLGAESKPGWTTLGDWVNYKHPGAEDLLLQIDIEGGEWPVLKQVTPAELKRFRIIAIELHDLHELFLAEKFFELDAAIAKLLEDFVIVHIHPNNIQADIQIGNYRIPPVIEMTLLRRDRVTSMQPIQSLPRTLDRKNNPHISDVLLEPYWYE